MSESRSVPAGSASTALPLSRWMKMRERRWAAPAAISHEVPSASGCSAAIGARRAIHVLPSSVVKLARCSNVGAAAPAGSGYTRSTMLSTIFRRPTEPSSVLLRYGLEALPPRYHSPTQSSSAACARPSPPCAP